MSGALAGEDGLAGAALAQWETKWNLEYSTKVDPIVKTIFC